MDHWNNCSNNGDGCEEEPYAMLQIFDIKVLPFTLDVTCPVEVYGIIAVRDDVDEYRRNYLFNRSRENPVIITPVSVTVSTTPSAFLPFILQYFLTF